MTTGEIDSYHVTTSSDINPYHDHRSARLLTDTPGGAWLPIYNDFQWIQVDFGGSRRVTGVSTQGRLHYDQWVAAYYVSYSNDGQGWTLYHEEAKQAPEVIANHLFHKGPFY